MAARSSYRQPALFLSHGSPMLALERGATARFLRGLGTRLSKPDVILAVSAHFETEEPTVTSGAHPETIHDFYGFPPELYRLRYPAPGNPALVARVKTLLAEAGIPARDDAGRGFDHGAWSPLLLIYPDAAVPLVELSVQPERDARWHYRIGHALAPLRDENVLVIGTGNLTHNLREARGGRHRSAPEWVSGFADWIAARAQAGDVEGLLDWQSRAPDALKNHPTPEHFLPFFTALGAGGEPVRAERLHADTELGVLAMDSYAFGSSALRAA